MDSDFRPAGRPAKSSQSGSKSQTAETPTPETNNFQTPDEVAATDDVGKSSKVGALTVAWATGESPKSWWHKLPFRGWMAERKWLASAAIILVCGSIVALVLTHVGAKPVASAGPVVVRKVPKIPKTVPSTLSGVPVDPSLNAKPVTGVMIENSLDARPQAGLSQAGVVFEAIAEGGITRFLALYQDTAPADIGPVRSARPYYVQWAMGFDAGYAHVGGSPEALNDIKAWGVRDLDQFFNSGAYHRIGSRVAPHNMYTSIDALNQLEASKGYTSSKFDGFVRKKAAPAKQPTAKSINLTLSGPLYNVHYDYNVASNTYNRSEGGAPHTDANGGQQISPAVVVALVMPYGVAADHHSQYGTIGSGQAFVFQDGTVTTGQWAKSSEKSQFVFTDAAGKPLKLNPGQTWLTAVANPGQVVSTP
jgi:hypothetical protein